MDPGSHVGFQTSTKNTNLVANYPMNISGKFGSILFSGFREDRLTIGNSRWPLWLDLVLTYDPMGKMLKSLLLWNQWVNLKQPWHEWTLDGQLSCHVCFKLAYSFQRRRFLNIFPIGSYVKIMSAKGGHLGWRSGSLDIILKVDHLRTIHAMFALNCSKPI
jgi:hypothetical protein